MANIIKVQGFENIYQADDFQADVDKMFGKNREQKRKFLSWLDVKLGILDTLGKDAFVLDSIHYKLLEETHPNLYEIRHPRSVLNERYIYAYCDGDDILLLAAFKEKNTSDFRSAINRAERILRELEEMNDGFEKTGTK